MACVEVLSGRFTSPSLSSLSVPICEWLPRMHSALQLSVAWRSCRKSRAYGAKFELPEAPLPCVGPLPPSSSFILRINYIMPRPQGRLTLMLAFRYSSLVWRCMAPSMLRYSRLMSCSSHSAHTHYETFGNLPLLLHTLQGTQLKRTLFVRAAEPHTFRLPVPIGIYCPRGASLYYFDAPCAPRCFSHLRAKFGSIRNLSFGVAS